MTEQVSARHWRVQVEQGLAVLVLSRPHALNALDLDMVRAMNEHLLAWRDDPTVRAVLVWGEARPGKAASLCAGGDIRFFHQAARQGDARIEDFFTEEYRLNHLIHTYPKPYVVHMQGVVMGGGMGIAQGATLRLLSPGAKLAMPETKIGLFPDVGSGWFLSRCPGRFGEYLALTGAVLGPHEALALGLGDAAIDEVGSEALQADLLRLLETHAGKAGVELAGEVRRWGGRLAARHEGAVDVPLLAHAGWIHEVFALETLEEIMAELARRASDAQEPEGVRQGMKEALLTLEGRSPLMCKVSLALVRRARGMTLAQDLRLERGLIRRCFERAPQDDSEAVEGIRALAVDKDHRPRWRHAGASDVTDAEVERFFEPVWPDHIHPLRDLEAWDGGTRA